MNQKLKKALFTRMRVFSKNKWYGPFDMVMRYIAWGFTSVLIRLPITGNQVTIISIFVNLAAAAAMISGSLKGYILGFALSMMGDVCDRIDGTIARYRNEVTKLQSDFLGRLYHIATTGFFFAAVGLGVFNQTGNKLYLVLGFLTAIFQQTTIYVLELKSSVFVNYGSEFLKKKVITTDNIRRMFVDNERKKQFVEYFSMPIDYLLIKFIILAFALVDKMTWFVLFYFWYMLIRLLLFTSVSYLKLKQIEMERK